jgi:putative transposase
MGDRCGSIFIRSNHISMDNVTLTARSIVEKKTLLTATKLLYLALQNIAKKWTKPIKNWRKALNQFAIFFEGRVPTQ